LAATCAQATRRHGRVRRTPRSAGAAVVADRPAYFKDFLDNFYNVDVVHGTRISD
jgi:hypothetical protein